MIPLAPSPAPDILTASGRVGAARLTAMPRESPGRPLKPLRPSVSGLGSRDTVLGLPGQPVKAARPSTAVLGPLKLQCLNKIGQQIAVGIWVSYVTSCYVTSCSVCPGSSWGWGGGGGSGRRGEWGGGGQTMRSTIGTDWDHILQTHFAFTHYHK